MYQHSQVHKEYLQNIQVILGVALLNKTHFFKATNDFSAELAQLEKEQGQDLASPEMAWWEPRAITEEQYLNQLGADHGYM